MSYPGYGSSIFKKPWDFWTRKNTHLHPDWTEVHNYFFSAFFFIVHYFYCYCLLILYNAFPVTLEQYNRSYKHYLQYNKAINTTYSTREFLYLFSAYHISHHQFGNKFGTLSFLPEEAIWVHSHHTLGYLLLLNKRKRNLEMWLITNDGMVNAKQSWHFLRHRWTRRVQK